MSSYDPPNHWFVPLRHSKNWKEEISLYMELAHGNKKDAYQVKMLKYLLGETGREIYKTLEFEKSEDELSFKEVIKAFDQACDPKKNEILERYKFFTRDQASGEGIEAYQTELKILAKTCNFGDLTSSLLRDRIVCGIQSSSLRARLLRQDNLTLDTCVKACKAAEMSKEQMNTMEKCQKASGSSTGTASVDKISGAGGTRKKTRQYKKNWSPKKDSDSSNDNRNNCKKCGRSHGPRACPAYG